MLLVTSLFAYGRDRGQISFIWYDDVSLGGTLDDQECYCLNVCILKSYAEPISHRDGTCSRALPKCLGHTDRSSMKEMNELLEKTYCYFSVRTQGSGHLGTGKGSLPRQHICHLDLRLSSPQSSRSVSFTEWGTWAKVLCFSSLNGLSLANIVFLLQSASQSQSHLHQW